MPTVGVFAAIFNAQGHILCVQRNYGRQTWALPGGKMEKGESPLKALQREVEEETGYRVEPKHLIGIYSAAYKDDLVLFFAAEILSQGEWQSDAEIAQWKFFSKDELPQPMHPNALTRIQDAFERRTSLIRIFEEDRG